MHWCFFYFHNNRKNIVYKLLEKFNYHNVQNKFKNQIININDECNEHKLHIAVKAWNRKVNCFRPSVVFTG